MDSDSKKWFAVYTKPRWEKKVADLLTRNGIENYCPLNKVQKQWSDRKKIVHEPLFTSYVFVRTQEDGHLAVRQTGGIVNFVYWLGKPAVIRDEDIEIIKRFLNEHDNVKVVQTGVSLNDKVRVISGPLMMREGNVVEIKHKSVKVLLPSLGFTLVAEVEKVNLEKISGKDPQQK